MMLGVRTTVTLEPDVAHALQEAVRREGRSFKGVLNDALRRGLARQSRADPKAFQVVPHEAALRPGYDPTAFNRLSDELEDTSFVERNRR